MLNRRLRAFGSRAHTGQTLPTDMGNHWTRAEALTFHHRQSRRSCGIMVVRTPGGHCNGSTGPQMRLCKQYIRGAADAACSSTVFPETSVKLLELPTSQHVNALDRPLFHGFPSSTKLLSHVRSVRSDDSALLSTCTICTLSPTSSCRKRGCRSN
jgi:hypothetical protein